MSKKVKKQHTTGPWKIVPRDDYFIYAEDQAIAKLFNGSEENARLIAAAPELLEVLAEAEAQVRNRLYVKKATWLKMVEVINKIRGL